MNIVNTQDGTGEVSYDSSMQKVYGLAEIAELNGLTRSAASMRYKRGGWLPKPDYVMGENDRPLWKRSTLEKAGVLHPPVGKSKHAD